MSQAFHFLQALVLSLVKRLLFLAHLLLQTFFVVLKLLNLLHSLHCLPFRIKKDVFHVDIIELMRVILPFYGFFKLSTRFLKQHTLLLEFSKPRLHLFILPFDS